MVQSAMVLCRRRKNNPLLVGESGVGKTAIAEGLAWRIVQGFRPGQQRTNIKRVDGAVSHDFRHIALHNTPGKAWRF
jgi:ATP-dependent Clp protease ATP-binding subunit ClpA